MHEQIPLGSNKQEQATTKANTGILRFAQNDKRFIMTSVSLVGRRTR